MCTGVCASGLCVRERVHDLSRVSLLQSGLKQKLLRRDTTVRLNLAELTAELDLDVLNRLETLSRALSHTPSQPQMPLQVALPAVCPQHRHVS